MRALSVIAVLVCGCSLLVDDDPAGSSTAGCLPEPDADKDQFISVCFDGDATTQAIAQSSGRELAFVFPEPVTLSSAGLEIDRNVGVASAENLLEDCPADSGLTFEIVVSMAEQQAGVQGSPRRILEVNFGPDSRDSVVLGTGDTTRSVVVRTPKANDGSCSCAGPSGLCESNVSASLGSDTRHYLAITLEPDGVTPYFDGIPLPAPNLSCSPSSWPTPNSFTIALANHPAWNPEVEDPTTQRFWSGRVRSFVLTCSGLDPPTITARAAASLE